MSNNSLHILFIGNSHTYYNDMPRMVQQRFVDEGYDCRVVMIAHPEWYLAQHAEEPDVRFNILYGGYDYIVLQEYAHPFGPEDKFLEAAEILTDLSRQGGSISVIFETWARKDEPEIQDYMNTVHRRVASKTFSLLAPVGEDWWDYMRSWPELEMYDADGAHASEAGSDFAAKTIWNTIQRDMRRQRD